MSNARIVIDTNVIYASLYSTKGASHALLKLLADGTVTACLSVTLVFEYEEVLKRDKSKLGLNDQDINAILGYLVSRSERTRVFYLWRPYLRDHKDDMVLEVAVAGKVDYLVTHNLNDFKGADRFGIKVVTPGWLIKNLGVTL